jgi:hypothetical protein
MRLRRESPRHSILASLSPRTARSLPGTIASNPTNSTASQTGQNRGASK